MYVEYGGDADDHSVSFICSRLYQLLDRHQNTIRLRVNVPKMSVRGMLVILISAHSVMLLLFASCDSDL